MAIEKIPNGMTGAEAADLLYQNDLANAPVNSVGGTNAPTGDAVVKYISDGVAADLASIGEYESELLVKFNPEPVFRANTSSSFSGFGDILPATQDFNLIQLYYKDRSDILKATKMRYRVCENDMNGQVWASGELELDVPDNAEVWIPIPIPSIENPANSPVWFEFYTDGKADRYESNLIGANRRFRYKAYVNPGHWTKNFAEESTEATSDIHRYMAVRLIKEARTILPSERFAEEVMNTAAAPGEIEAGETRAVPGGKVYEKTRAYDDVIEMKVHETSAVQLGGISGAYNSSTFAGWGQQIGIRDGFNILRFNVYPYSAEFKPTYYELRIRNNDKDGAVLFTKRIEVNTVPLQRQVIEFDVGTFVNPGGVNLFVQINSDGYFSAYYTTTGAVGGVLHWTVHRATSTVTSTVPTASAMMDVRIIWGERKGTIKQDIIDQLVEAAGGGVAATPDAPIASRAYLYPGAQYNIYTKNAVVPALGDRVDNYFVDFASSQGAHFKRGYRLTAPASLNAAVTLTIQRGRAALSTLTQTMLSAAANAASGVTRKVLIIGDSTVNGSNISTPLKTVFDADPMNITLIGTLGAAGVKHEGRGGWTVNDYYGIGRVLYVINVSGVTTPPGVGAVYEQGGVQYSVVEVNMTGGDGYFSVQSSGSNRPVDASGTLTKVSGTGSPSITYGVSSVTSSNPFYNPTTERFDLGHYLTTTGQTMAANDWVFFQLGINDVFGLTTEQSASDKVSTMAAQLRFMLDNIRAYNAGIRVGLVVTFPPADQNAFAVNYAAGQTSEMYIKTGLIAWQKKMLQEFDNQAERDKNRYLIPANLNLDTDYNYPTSTVPVNSRNATTETIQSNGVHPSATGYAQIADMYAGAIKYFG